MGRAATAARRATGSVARRHVATGGTKAPLPVSQEPAVAPEATRPSETGTTLLSDSASESGTTLLTDAGSESGTTLLSDAAAGAPAQPSETGTTLLSDSASESGTTLLSKEVPHDER